MAIMQVFYDYECPYSKKGYEYLMEQIGNFPEIKVEWRPIEAHPLPENSYPHTHLACQSFYAAKEMGVNINKFHAAMYQAVAIEHKNVERPEVLCEILKDILDVSVFRAILDSGKYAKQVDENNDLAYEKSGVWYLPAFRMNGRKLDAKGGAGIAPQELRAFLKGTGNR